MVYAQPDRDLSPPPACRGCLTQFPPTKSTYSKKKADEKTLPCFYSSVVLTTISNLKTAAAFPAGRGRAAGTLLFFT